MVFICRLSAQYTLHGVKTQGLLSVENSPRENMKIYDVNTHLLKSVQTSGTTFSYFKVSYILTSVNLDEMTFYNISG
jgi:hypothetical protein